MEGYTPPEDDAHWSDIVEDEALLLREVSRVAPAACLGPIPMAPACHLSL